MLAYGFMNVKPVTYCYAPRQVIVVFFALMPLWHARLGSKVAKIAVATKIAKVLCIFTHNISKRPAGH